MSANDLLEDRLVTVVMSMEDSNKNTNNLLFHFYNTFQNFKLFHVENLLFEVTTCQLFYAHAIIAISGGDKDYHLHALDQKTEAPRRSDSPKVL